MLKKHYKNQNKKQDRLKPVLLIKINCNFFKINRLADHIAYKTRNKQVGILL